ncbi:hypothetical protein [Agreia sp. VKM Ac-1783]|uniref:hypothetical protein n=1 Tax=Agreia sp. VKM Ac-1783 TaxID=1938889 RepID=UPI000A3AAA4A|nr:hypothetical protein [Agreia sp. VKM Ac-1783]
MPPTSFPEPAEANSAGPRWSSRSPATVSRPPADGLDTLRPQAASGYSTSAALEREALARAAYGRTTSPEDEVRAAEAARELHELDLREAAERQALHQATLDAAAARERRAHRIRSRSVRVVGTLAVLGVIAAGAATLLQPPEARQSDLPRTIPATGESRVDLGLGTIATTQPGPVGRTSSGSAASAEHWFDEPQKDTDRLAQTVGNIDPSSTRAVDPRVEGWQVFVAKDTAGGFCVIARETPNGVAGAGCATPDQFTSAGILLNTGGSTSITVYWDGFDLTVESSPSS